MILKASLLSLFFFLTSKPKQELTQKSIYDFKIKSLEGKEINFISFKGKKILIVNTASKCGFTYQYEDLEKLYETYKDKLVIVGFPANDFLYQEPGTNEEIKNFCTQNYKVTFPMSEKITVKGKEMHPIYIWLTQKKYNGLGDFNITWNFNKFLLDENGKLIAKFNSKVKPMDDEITNLIK